MIRLKKTNYIILLFLFLASPSFAYFSPTLLKLSAPDVIPYDFDGSVLEIPVTVSGTDAKLYFLVNTSNIADQIPNMRNGYLGWHHVNKVDTCVYLSPSYQFGAGAKTITWDGKDNDGGVVPPGEYTYYMWAYDNISQKQLVCEKLPSGNMRQVYFQEVDESGMPLNNPLYCSTIDPCFRWEIGNDPYDMSLLEETNIVLPDGFEVSKSSNLCLDPYDFDYFYLRVGNPEQELGAILKYKYVPNGDAVLQTDFGQDGYGMLISCPYMYEPGVVTDGNYLYSGDSNHTASTEPDAELYIVDFDGVIVEEIDLTPWWSRPDEAAQGKRMNSGPDHIRERNGKLFLNCYGSCIKQMVDPVRYMTSRKYEDFFVWSNLNGDYVLDQSFEEAAAVTWACNYPNSGYHFTIDADDNFFTFCPHYAASFGLIAPDGTGIGFCSFAGETGGFIKYGNFFIDSDTPYDGIYCDWTHYPKIAKSSNYPGRVSDLNFVGHDSIKGTIRQKGTKVEKEHIPFAFSLSQNVPNPFNLSTTITFTLERPCPVKLTVYNILGERIDVLVEDFLSASTHSVEWNARGFAAGVYFYNLETRDFTETKRMILLK